MTTTTRPRTIQRVPALYISELFRLGKLPSVPQDTIAASRVPESRDPTLAEFSALVWIIVGIVHTPYGVASFRDTYDFQTSSDVREILHIAGSRRGVYELVKFLIADARPRRCIGTLECNNRMIGLARRFGGTIKRVRWESR